MFKKDESNCYLVEGTVILSTGSRMFQRKDVQYISLRKGFIGRKRVSHMSNCSNWWSL